MTKAMIGAVVLGLNATAAQLPSPDATIPQVCSLLRDSCAQSVSEGHTKINTCAGAEDKKRSFVQQAQSPMRLFASSQSDFHAV